MSRLGPLRYGVIERKAKGVPEAELRFHNGFVLHVSTLERASNAGNRWAANVLISLHDDGLW